MIRWTEEASADFVEIHEYISRDNPAAADRQGELIMGAVAQLDRFPMSGKRTRRRHIRTYVVPGSPFVIQYTFEGTTVALLSILHGARRKRRFRSA